MNKNYIISSIYVSLREFREVPSEAPLDSHTKAIVKYIMSEEDETTVNSSLETKTYTPHNHSALHDLGFIASTTRHPENSGLNEF